VSDFSMTSRCPGCGRRFCPDDGECCLRCEQCGEWAGDGLFDMDNTLGCGEDAWICDDCWSVYCEGVA
jgi:hypothetical protein